MTGIAQACELDSLRARLLELTDRVPTSLLGGGLAPGSCRVEEGGIRGAANCGPFQACGRAHA